MSTLQRANRIRTLTRLRGLASPSLETPSVPALGVGGVRNDEDFGVVEGFGVVGPVDADAGRGDVCVPGSPLPYFASGSQSAIKSRVRRIS